VPRSIPRPRRRLQSAKLRFKTTALTTFQAERDQNMRDWLKVSVHPDATFLLENVKVLEGDVQKADVQHPAKFQVSGTLVLMGQTAAWRECLGLAGKRSPHRHWRSSRGHPAIWAASGPQGLHDGRHAGQDALPVLIILPPDYALK